jgi:hypothetical protein
MDEPQVREKSCDAKQPKKWWSDVLQTIAAPIVNYKAAYKISLVLNNNDLIWQ